MKLCLNDVAKTVQISFVDADAFDLVVANFQIEHLVGVLRLNVQKYLPTIQT